MVSIDTYNACVDFPIFDAKSRSMKKAFLGAAGGAIGRNKDNTVVVEALRNVNLHLREGDRVGLVGHNGAGKSTLLRLLSGIYEPTRGLFLGQTRKQMKQKMDEIADFSELGEYLSMPLRTYSTGMRIRLALGVVTSIEPEILLLDEGIGAVDAAFMAKARARLQELVKRSGILVFASHSNDFLAQLCDTALWIDHGEVREAGPIPDIVESYEGPGAAEHVRRIIEDLHNGDAENMSAAPE